MRRIALLLATIAAVLGSAIAITSSGNSAQAGDDYRVDVIFDTAKGILPQQLVKIAGAKVGTVKDVKVTADYKARIQLEVDSKFAPFKTDAQCQIQPEGLISENFVQCTPGTPEGRELESVDGNAPTVPVENTSVPVSLTDLFNIWKVPVRDRFSVVLAGLGGGVAGKGEDLNEVLRRASPTLSLVRKVTAIADQQKTELGTLVTASDKLIAELAERRRDVTRFIDDADKVTARTVRKQSQLRESVRRLPALLAATEPALARLDELAASAQPLLVQLRDAAPQTSRLISNLAPFARSGRTALKELGSTADQGRITTRSAKPVVRQLKIFAHKAIPAGAAVDAIFGSLRTRGFSENLLKLVYGVGATASRYDQTAHLAPARLNLNACSVYAVQTNLNCSARYSGVTGSNPVARKKTTRPDAKPKPAPKADTPKVQLPEVPAPKLPKLPKLPDLLPKVDLDPPKVLQDLGKTLDNILGTNKNKSDNSGNAQKGLLDYLLK